MGQLLTPEQVAASLQVTRRTVYSWLRSGRLIGHKAGPRSWRVEPTALAKFLWSPSVEDNNHAASRNKEEAYRK